MVKKYRVRLPNGDILLKTDNPKLLEECLKRLKTKVKIEVLEPT